MWVPTLRLSDRAHYLAIVEALEADISAGRLALGDRLPTHRELAAKLGLSVGTVTRAYADAASRGLILGHTGRGTFVGGTTARKPSLQADESSQHIDLGPTWPLYAHDPDLGATLRVLMRRKDVQSLLRYSPHAGAMRHRLAGAMWARRYCVETKPERVLLCSGVQHALVVILSTLAEPGDVILTESLTYPGMKAAAHLLNLRLRGVEMDRDGICPEAFERACRGRRVRALYTIPTIHNPTTWTTTAERRREIAAIAVRRGVPIIEDEAHQLLETSPPQTYWSLVPEATYFIAGLSKVVTGALRVTYVVVPAEAVERTTEAIWATTWMVPPITAEIAALWIEDGTADRTVARKRREATARQRIAGKLLPIDGMESHPQALNVWIDPVPRRSVEEVVRAALREGVIVTPGSAFSAGSDAGKDALRVSLSAAGTRTELRRGLTILAGIFGSGRR